MECVHAPQYETDNFYNLSWTNKRKKLDPGEVWGIFFDLLVGCWIRLLKRMQKVAKKVLKIR